MQSKLAITGMGAVTPIGIGVDQYWENLVAGKCGIGPITHFDASSLPVRIAAEIRSLQQLPEMPRTLARSASPFMRMAFAAGTEALRNAGLLDMPDPIGTGICMATAMAGVVEIAEQATAFQHSRSGKVSPHFIPRAIGNMAAACLAIEYGIKGPGLTIGTACSAGNDAIIAAAMLLRAGDAKAVLVIGAESILTPAVISSLAQAKALSRRNDNPQKASRPFDLERDGFVIGEGAGALVLETMANAQSRGREPLACLAGWGNTMDAWHVTAPEPAGEGAARCMRLSLGRANLQPSQIGYINTHGTATPLGDLAETRAIKTVFGSTPPPASSTKGATGHLMAAGGLTESIACIQALNTGLLPPTLNLEYPDPACDLDYIPQICRQQPIAAAMTNSMGFGGQNSCLVFTKATGVNK